MLLTFTDLQPFPPVRLNCSIPFHCAKLVGHWDELVGPVPYLGYATGHNTDKVLLSRKHNLTSYSLNIFA